MNTFFETNKQKINISESEKVIQNKKLKYKLPQNKHFIPELNKLKEIPSGFNPTPETYLNLLKLK